LFLLVFAEAQERLEKLEAERLHLDHELGIAREKVMSSEKSKEVLEAKLRVSTDMISCSAISFSLVSHPLTPFLSSGYAPASP